MTTEYNTDVTNVERDAWERPVMVRLDAADAQNTAGGGADRNVNQSMVNS